MRQFAITLILSLTLVPASANAVMIALSATLDCAQANAGAGTCGAGGSGTGSGSITLDTETNMLSWNVTWSGLSDGPATLAHFHGPAFPNQHAGVQVGITAVSPSNGAVIISAGQATDLLSDLWYLNIHTAAFPGGEIRGQVLLVPEPTTAILMGLGLVGLAAARRRA